MASHLQDELTRTVLLAAQSLTTCQKADFLLQTALSMIDSGRYVASILASMYLKILPITGMGMR